MQSPMRRSSPTASPDKGSPINRERYLEKDSLYLDTGKPEMTGKIETLNSGTTNSLMFANRFSDLSSPEKTSHNSMSPFGKGGLENYKKGSASKSFRYSNFGNQATLKNAILNHHHKNANEESKDDFSPPLLRLERLGGEKRRSGESSGKNSPDKSRLLNQSPGFSKSNSASNDNSPFHLKVEHVHSGSPIPITKSTYVGNRRLQSLTQKQGVGDLYKNKSDVIPRK